VAEPGSIIFGATTIAYSIRRSRRRKKTIEITLDPSEGVVVSAPVKATATEVARIVQRRAGWIIRKSTESILRPRPKQFVSGESLPYLGREVRLFILRSAEADQDERRGRARVSVRFDHWSFRVVAPDHLTADDRRAAILQAITRWYKQRAQERLEARVLLWSGKLGCQVTRMVTRDQRQRWGSCAPDGTLRFNWRIVMAQPALIDYVVVHELLHLKVRNHGPGFWAEMAAALPDYRVRRTRLKEFGRGVAF
jgi:predicted metal-dependent hydrolase